MVPRCATRRRRRRQRRRPCLKPRTLVRKRTDGRNGGMRNRIDRSKKEERNPPTRRQASALFTIDPLRRTDGRTDESHECPKGTRKRRTGAVQIVRSILREFSSGDARVNLSGPVSVKRGKSSFPRWSIRETDDGPTQICGAGSVPLAIFGYSN